MKIAGHHLVERDPYRPRCEWGEDVTVQWGDCGSVFSPHGSYVTAFFEAFPKGFFIRGEGKTVSDAELDAFIKYERMLACGNNHQWRRGSYLNGGAHCRVCGQFGTPFKPINPLGHMLKPLTWWEKRALSDHDLWVEKRFIQRETPDEQKLFRQLRLRLFLFGWVNKEGEPQPAAKEAALVGKG
ncbi:hypothetical protein [Ponticaulis profundi]|uniref:HNH endonuclease n=1 Tax=Ponticaulis profundi TaxID=2665222 RepID=A0ABW1S8E0_9PROT